MNACGLLISPDPTDQGPSLSGMTRIPVMGASFIHDYSSPHLPKWLVWQQLGQLCPRGQYYLGLGSDRFLYSGP